MSHQQKTTCPITTDRPLHPVRQSGSILRTIYVAMPPFPIPYEPHNSPHPPASQAVGQARIAQATTIHQA
ncbi:hypothetical protein N7501_004457 [Penicillium viridicatum]|nr:hypothetical protein N7501_004457 [Penicillium viridicatum]